MDCSANPSLDKLSDYKVVAAFDIGSTYSGYAWSLRTAPGEIMLNEPWGSEYTTQTCKAPTAILTNKDMRFIAFGYKAKMMYNAEGNRNYLFDQNLKMKLHKAKKEDVYVTSRDGKQTISLRTLMMMVIRFLYQHMVDALCKSHICNDVSVVRVILTVPAIWPEYAKNFMRTAACEAGIDKDRLILALEPEAASLYCRTLSPAELQSSNSDEVCLNMPNGTRYAVIDCGGGTVDITVHETVDDQSVKEIYSANGGPWGGGQVNEEFEKLLKDLLGENFIYKFKISHVRDWFDIYTHFEYIKRAYNVNSEFNIALPYSLIKAYEKQGHTDIEQDINRRKADGFEFCEGRLIMKPGIVEKLFTSSTDNIIQHVDNLWKNNEIANVKYAFMVGGFSECAPLFNRVSNTIARADREVQVIRPTSADTSVLMGAVQFGHMPQAITSRISRLTYGPGIMLKFDPNMHDADKKIIVDGEAKCDEVFDVWAKKNEKIAVGEKRTYILFPHNKSCKRFYVSIYAVDKEEVKYITDPGVRKLASLEIPIPDNHLPQFQRAVKHDVYFGGTELHVRIQDEARPDGASTESTITFNCT